MFSMKYLAVFFAIVAVAYGRVYDHCEFAHEIQNYGIPADQVAVWTCIAKHESEYDTAAVNPSSGDHGILQISQLFWCSVSGSPGGGCNAVCSQFEDDNIADDVACARTVWEEHQRLDGNGFLAWTTYLPYCAGDVSQYVAGC